MAEVLTIKFEDGAGSKPVPPSPPSPTGAGVPPAIPGTAGPTAAGTPGGSSTAATMLRLLSEQLRIQWHIYAEVQRISGSSPGGGTGSPTPAAGAPTGKPKKGLTDEQKDLVDKVSSSIILAVRAVTGAFDFAAQQIAIAGKQSAALIRGDVQTAKVADVEEKQNIAGTIGSVIGGIAGFAFGGPIGSRIGSAVLGKILGAVFGGNILSSIGQSLFGPAKASQEKVNQDMMELRARTTEMARYNQSLAQQTALGNVAKQRRDIAESQILGKQYGDLEARQQQLERINQMVAILEKSGKANEQAEAINKEIAQSNKRLEKLMASTDKNTRDMVKELEKQAKTPLEVLEAKGGFAKPDERGGIARERDLLDRMRDAGLNVPLLGEGR